MTDTSCNSSHMSSTTTTVLIESSFDGRRVARGVLLGMGWFVGLITPKSQGRTKNVCVYLVHLEADQSVRSMNLLSAAYRTENGAAVGAWVFLEPNDASR